MKKKLINAALLARAEGPLASRSAFNFVAKALPRTADGRGKSWYSIAKSATADAVDILIYDEIGFWGVQASEFVTALAAVDAKTINLRVNSPGGSVFDGLAIYQALAAHPAKIIAHVDGWAASIASVIIMSADTIMIGEAAQIMVHQPWSMVMGPADDMRKEADILDSLEAAIIDVYVARTGGTRDEIAAWVKDETWFKGQAAVDAGFADEVTPLKLKTPGKPAAKLDADFFAAIFPHLPEEVRADLAAPADEKSIKGFDFEHGTRSEFEDFLRASSASGKRAKAITNTGFKPTTDRPGDAKSGEEPTATDRPGDAVRRAATVAAVWNATHAYPRI